MSISDLGAQELDPASTGRDLVLAQFMEIAAMLTEFIFEVIYWYIRQYPE